MKRTLSFLALVAFAVASASVVKAQAPAPANTYTGVKVCALCHKTEARGGQVAIWEKSKHAQAYTALTTPEANEIAKAKGITTPAAESPACLECHAIVGDAKADVKDGVQCEMCHGPGSGYRALSVMKNKAESIAAGMTEYKDPAAIEARCRKCHNERSPTTKVFNFEERWAAIRHPAPRKVTLESRGPLNE